MEIANLSLLRRVKASSVNQALPVARAVLNNGPPGLEVQFTAKKFAGLCNLLIEPLQVCLGHWPIHTKSHHCTTAQNQCIGKAWQDIIAFDGPVAHQLSRSLLASKSCLTKMGIMRKSKDSATKPVNSASEGLLVLGPIRFNVHVSAPYRELWSGQKFQKSRARVCCQVGDCGR